MTANLTKTAERPTPASGAGPDAWAERALEIAAVATGAEGAALLVQSGDAGPWRAKAQWGGVSLEDAVQAAFAREEHGVTPADPGRFIVSVPTAEGAARVVLARENGWSAEAAQRGRLLSGFFADLVSGEAARDALAQKSQALARVIEDLSIVTRSAKIGVWSYDRASRRVTWSAELLEMFGTEEEIHTLADVRRLLPEGGHAELDAAIRVAIAEGAEFEVEQCAEIGGLEKWLRVVGQPLLRDGRVVGLRGCAQDITDETQTREDMTLLATRDYLTEIANRASFTNLFEAAIKQCDFETSALWLFIIDIDHFKNINDSYGHDVGDQVLREVTRILCAAVREKDVVGRLGGDEFGVFVRGVRGSGLGDVVGERILATTEAQDSLRKIGGGVTLSIGFTEVAPGATFKSALKEADLALYDGKRAGRARATPYRDVMGVQYENRERVLHEVADALQHDQFLPHYQVKVALDDGSVAGFEALARWGHPERGLLSPGAFWEALQDLRLATRISEQVLEQAACDAGRLKRLGHRCGRIAVNVTEKQIAEPDFAQRLRALAERNGVACSDLEVEITEAVLLARDVDSIRSTLGQLSEMGVLLSLDDFGTGYASLTHLRAFPIDQIKIDKSFVTDLDQSRDNRAIVEAVIHMAQDLEIQVVAEGVETAIVAERLAELGCDTAQGFYFGRPAPFEDAVAACRARCGDPRG